ncbi:hypothetical protein FWD20_01220 [Candidatus Saccharibacteria bacterium]|nr:hypothetical protein [Candidatus Saccharibacteria bacterium]
MIIVDISQRRRPVGIIDTTIRQDITSAGAASSLDLAKLTPPQLKAVFGEGNRDISTFHSVICKAAGKLFELSVEQNEVARFVREIAPRNAARLLGNRARAQRGYWHFLVDGAFDVSGKVQAPESDMVEDLIMGVTDRDSRTIRRDLANFLLDHGLDIPGVDLSFSSDRDKIPALTLRISEAHGALSQSPLPAVRQWLDVTQIPSK